MKRLLAIPSVTLLILSGSLFVAPAQRVVQANGQPTLPTALEQLPISNDSQTFIISPSSGASYRSVPIAHGIKLWYTAAHADVRLGNHYSVLSGTVYQDDRSGGDANLAIYNSTSPSHPYLLWHTTLHQAEQASFRIAVGGIVYLTLAKDGYYTSILDIVGSLTPVNQPAPAAHPSEPQANGQQVQPLYPAQGTGVPTNSRVLFAWKPFPGASRYAFHVWMTKGTSMALPASAPVTFSATIAHGISYTWSNDGFRPGSYSYQLLPLDGAGTALGTWSAPVSISIVG